MVFSTLETVASHLFSAILSFIKKIGLFLKPSQQTQRLTYTVINTNTTYLHYNIENKHENSSVLFHFPPKIF